MHSLLPHHRKPAGFVQSAVLKMLLMVYLAAAVLNLCLGHWIIAAALLLPLLALFVWTRYLIQKDRCQKGDRICVSMGVHAGNEGTIIAVNEAETRFTVQLSSSEHPEPVDFSAYQFSRTKPVTAASAPDETHS